MKKIFLFIPLLVFSLFTFSQDSNQQLYFNGSEITIYGDRIPIEQKKAFTLAAPILVITEDEIKEKGFKTLSEVIESLPSSFGKDITGNPVQRSIDLRGFPSGQEVVLFLNGVKMNNISDNSLDFELIPVDIIERVEVYSGALAPLYGGGAIGGVINIITKSGETIPKVDLTLSGGSFNDWEKKVSFSGSKGKFSLFSTLSFRNSQGYRENDGYNIKDAILNMDYSFDKNDHLTFIFKHQDQEISNPGALTEEEMKVDRRQSPFNLYDGSRGRHTLLASTYTNKINEKNDITFEIYSRQRNNDILTTGRFLSGFQTRGEETLSGAIGEYRFNTPIKDGNFYFSSAIEYSRGKNIANGYYTDFYGNILLLGSSNKVIEKTFGGYLNFSYVIPKWKFDIGSRSDESKYKYYDFLIPQNSTEKVFSQKCMRSSLTHFISDNETIFFAFSEGYKIPTVIELFAYPQFYSNPDLKPVRVNDFEVGYKYFGENIKTKVTLYKMYLRDETVFVLTDPIHFIGMNKNVGKSQRKGVEGDLKYNLKNGYEIEFNATIRDSEVTGGPYEGNEIPMVPKEMFSLYLTKRVEKFVVNLGAKYVSSTYLDNDLNNLREKLPSYTVFDLNLKYQKGKWTYGIKVNNLLDKEYSTRGVTNGYQDFFIPAYPLSAKVFITYSF